MPLPTSTIFVFCTEFRGTDCFWLYELPEMTIFVADLSQPFWSFFQIDPWLLWEEAHELVSMELDYRRLVLDKNFHCKNLKLLKNQNKTRKKNLRSKKLVIFKFLEKR